MVAKSCFALYSGMAKKTKLMSLGVLVLLAILFIFMNIKSASFQNPQKVLYQMKDHQITLLRIGEKTLNVEVVNTPVSRNQGLSDREEIGSDGMLFVFPGKGVAQFWMKDMNFDLDFIWIADGKVVEITRNVQAPQPGIPLSELTTYQPSQPMEMMLEVRAGDTEKWGIKVGMLVNR